MQHLWSPYTVGCFKCSPGAVTCIWSHTVWLCSDVSQIPPTQDLNQPLILGSTVFYKESACQNPQPPRWATEQGSSRSWGSRLTFSQIPAVLEKEAPGSFPMSRLLASGGQSIGASASASILTMNIQGWFSLGLTGLISLLSKGLSRFFSSTTVQKHPFFGAQPLVLPLMVCLMCTLRVLCFIPYTTAETL